jgi:uncharacterized protein YqeY
VGTWGRRSRAVPQPVRRVSAELVGFGDAQVCLLVAVASGGGGCPDIPVGRTSYSLSKLSVLEQVRADAVKALKAGERDLVSALRLLVSELQKDAREGTGDELAVLRRERKRRLDAAEQFEAGNRPELAQKERSEAELIDGYLPAEMDDAKLEELVRAAVTETGASSPKDMGAVMKALMAKADGQVDGRRASAAVKAALSG